VAHARGLAAAGILKPAQLVGIERGLRRVKRELDSDQFEFADGDEDIHTAIERRLTEITRHGAALHAGRSRNDQVATDLRLFCRYMAAGAVELIAALVGELSLQAGRHAAWAMPGYTHLQRAQPVTAGHHLMAHAEPLLRDAVRFRNSYDSADELPLGSGALAASTLPLRRDVLAKQLGFARISANSIDAVADRDFALDLVYACLTTALHLSRLGEDVVLWSTSEFGFVELADEIATGSSLMPQKKNPDVAELLRARPSRVLGSFTSLAMMLKGLPLAYDRDLQDDKQAVFAAVADTVGALEAAALLVRHLKFDRGHMSEAAADPGLRATDLAEIQVMDGVPFRRAHESVGRMVREGGIQPPWSVARSLEERDLPGGPTPGRVRARAREAAREARALAKWAKRHPPPLPL
jgi:argininosuccinate lyase